MDAPSRLSVVSVKLKPIMNTWFLAQLVRSSVLLGLLFSAVVCAQGAALGWDTVAGDGGVITPGSGVWATGAGNWNNGTTNVNWANNDTATFGGTDGAYTVDVTGNITLGSGAALSFTNSGYTLSAVTATNAQTVSLANKIINIAAGKTATVGTNVTLNRNVGSTKDIAFSGGGTLIIGPGGTVTQTGVNASEIGSGTTVHVTGGTLSLLTSFVIGKLDTAVNTNGQLIVDSGAVTVGGTGNLIPGRTAGEVAALTVNGGTVTADGGQLRTDNGTATVTLNGGVVSTRQVARAGGTSALTFNGGTLKASSSATLAQKADFISGLTSVTVNNGGATIDPNGQAITIAQALLAGTGNGGLTVNDTAVTKGTLTLTGGNTYGGPTTINSGKLGIIPPYNSLGSSVVVNGGGRLRATANASSSTIPPITLNDGGGIEFNLGTYNPANAPALTNASLIVPNGTTNFIDIAGADIPVTSIVLLAYTNKTGTGVFQLGTLPTAMAATLTDTGSSLVLNVTSPSATLYTWSVGTGDWDIGASPNWNGGVTYLQPAVVVFPDSPSGTVNLTANVSPYDVDVIVTNLGVYNFTGTGSIDGTTGMDVLGIGSVTLGNSNLFSGLVTVSGGSGTVGAYVTVNHPRGLGATNGATVVNGPANTLALGTFSGAGVTVNGETVTINGTGVGGVRGALRGAAVTAGETNIWNGPVILGSSAARIGTEDSGNLTVAGVITDNGTNFGPVIRPGSGASVTLKAAGNNWGGNTTLFGSDATSTVIAGVNNCVPTNSPLFIGTCTFDMNGFNQTAPLVGLASSGIAASSILANSAGGISTMTINGTNNGSFSGDVTGNLAIVKNGPNTQTLSGANLTYSGSTTVNGGLLNLTGVNPLATAVTVNSGGTLGGEFTTTSSLTLNAGATVRVDPATPTAILANTITASTAPVFVSFTTAPPVGTPVLVLSNAAGFSGLAANFQPVGVRGGTFYLTNGNSELMYVAAPSSVVLTWKGNHGTNPTFWDVITTTNWNNGGSPDTFYTGDGVRFDDSASSFTVAIQGGSASPASMVVSNNVNAYSLGGGALAGPTSLVKQGLSELTLTGANSYSGGTVINGGQINFNNDSNLGAVPGVPTPANVILNGGQLTLVTANQTVNTNRGLEVQSGGGALSNAVPGTGNLSIPGIVAGSGRLTLGVTSSAGIIMTGSNTYSGGTVIEGPASGNVYITVGYSGSPGSVTSGPFGTGPVVFNGPGTRSTISADTTNGNPIIFAADTTFPTLSGEKTLTLEGPVTLSNSTRTLTVHVGTTVAGKSLTINGSIGQATPGLGLIKAGTGLLISSGTNTYTGNTTVNAGRLMLQQASLATNSTVSISNAAVLQLDFGATNTVAALVLNGVNQAAGIYDAASSSPLLAGIGALRVVPSATIPTAGTNLSYSIGGGQILLSWPSNYVGWYLQKQTNSRSVGLSSNWVTIPGSQNVTQTNFPVTPADPTVFFRMVHTNAP